MILKNKRAIVTGGSQGLGKAIVEQFLQEGAKVSFCARNSEDIKKILAKFANSKNLFGFTCDVSKPDLVKKFIQQTNDALGGIDILINNAGIYGPIGLIEKIDWEQWKQAMEINVYGLLHCCRAVIPQFKKQKYGKIINISGGGATNPMPRFSAYAASKAAVVRLTETLAEELCEFNIDVNAIAPGALKTRLIDQVLEAGAEKAGKDFFEKNKKWAETGATSPLLGAKLCAYLASDISNGITGKLISAQWDPWEKFHELKEELKQTDIYTLRRIVAEDRGKKWSK
ncbi:MAG: SDR family oxidoreductase [Verrucomicrobiia bacterium]